MMLCANGSMAVMWWRQHQHQHQHHPVRQSQSPARLLHAASAWPTFLSILTILLCIYISSTAHTHAAAAVTVITTLEQQHVQPHRSFQLHLADDWLMQYEYDSVRRVTQPHPSATAAYTYSHSHSHSSSTVAATLKWKEADIRTTASRADSHGHGVNAHRHDETDSAATAAASSFDSSHTHTHTHTHSFSSNHRSIHHSHTHTHTHRPLLHYTLLAEWHETGENGESADNIRTSGQHQGTMSGAGMRRDSPHHHPHHHQHHHPRHHQHQHHRRLLCSGAALTSCTAADLPIHTPITLQLIIHNISQTCDCQCQCECECDDECKTKKKQKRDHTNSRNDDTSCNPSSHHRRSLPHAASILSSPITITLQPHADDDDDVGGKAMRNTKGNTHHDPLHRTLTQAQSDASAGILTRHATRATPNPTTHSRTVTAVSASTAANSTSTPSPHRHHPHVAIGDEVHMMEMGSRHMNSSRESLHSHFQSSQSNDLNQDDELIAALCRFFNETNGANWKHNDGWAESCLHGNTSDVCDWYGIRCDASKHSILRLELQKNQLSSYSHQPDDPPSTKPKPFSIQVFEHLGSLNSLDLSANDGLVFPKPFNLTMLSQLRYLTFYRLTLDPMDASQSSIITLIPPPSITDLDLSQSAVDVDLRFLPSLEFLYEGLLPIDVEALPMMPKLGYLQLENTGMTCSSSGNIVTTGSNCSVRSSSDHDQSNGETTCDERILRILANLTQTNPQLNSLTMKDVHLDATDPGRSLSAFPIIHSASLQDLTLSGSWLPTLIPDEWLSLMPALTDVTLQPGHSGLHRLAMTTRSFELASSTRFHSIFITDVDVDGDASPLARFHR